MSHSNKTSSGSPSLTLLFNPEGLAMSISNTMLAAVVLPGWADTAAQASAVSIDNFTFGPQTLTVKVGTTVAWVNDIFTRSTMRHGDARSTAEPSAEDILHGRARYDGRRCECRTGQSAA